MALFFLKFTKRQRPMNFYAFRQKCKVALVIFSYATMALSNESHLSRWTASVSWQWVLNKSVINLCWSN